MLFASFDETLSRLVVAFSIFSFIEHKNSIEECRIKTTCLSIESRTWINEAISLNDSVVDKISKPQFQVTVINADLIEIARWLITRATISPRHAVTDRNKLI